MFARPVRFAAPLRYLIGAEFSHPCRGPFRHLYEAEGSSLDVSASARADTQNTGLVPSLGTVNCDLVECSQLTL